MPEDARPRQALEVLELAACSADAAVSELALYLASPCCTLTELDLSWNSLGPSDLGDLPKKRPGMTRRPANFHAEIHRLTMDPSLSVRAPRRTTFELASASDALNQSLAMTWPRSQRDVESPEASALPFEAVGQR